MRHPKVIPSENASPARTEGSRRENLKVTSSGSFDFAQDDGHGQSPHLDQLS
jgi:hypothetical protein